GSSGSDRDDAAGAGDGTGDGVRGGQRLIAGGRERGVEGPGAIAERAVGRQGGAAVGAGRVQRTGGAGGRVVELILGSDREREGAACGHTGRRGHGKVRGGRGSDRDGATGAGD